MAIIYCVVTPTGQVWASTESYAQAAAAAGVDVEACGQYRFHLATRQLIADRSSPAADEAVRAYLDRHFGTPEKLIRVALDGGLPKPVLSELLAANTRHQFLEACAAIERRYTAECVAAADPCLEVPSCGLDDEICLQPLLRAGSDYEKACAAEWAALFADPRNRADAWRGEAVPEIRHAHR